MYEGDKYAARKLIERHALTHAYTALASKIQQNSMKVKMLNEGNIFQNYYLHFSFTAQRSYRSFERFLSFLSGRARVFLFEKPQRQSARFVTKINQRLLTSGGYVDLRILCFPKIWKFETHSVDRVPQEFKLNFWHFHAEVRY